MKTAVGEKSVAMNRLACLAGLIVLCSFGSPVQAHAEGKVSVGVSYLYETIPPYISPRR
jgi:hypothetical protein